MNSLRPQRRAERAKSELQVPEIASEHLLLILQLAVVRLLGYGLRVRLGQAL